MRVLERFRRISLREATLHRRCLRVGVVIFLLTILLTHTLTGGLAAQIITPVVTDTPTATDMPAVEATPVATASAAQLPASGEPSRSEPSDTVALLEVAGNLAGDQLKALLRARIQALIRARIALSAAQQADNEQASNEQASNEQTVLLPMVMGGARTPSTQSFTNTVTAPAATIPITVTPYPPPAVEQVTPTPMPVIAPSPEPTPDGSPRTAQVSILMYHYLSEPPADANIYRRDLSVAPAVFAQHLDRLLAEGYTTVRLDDLLLNLTQGTPLPPKPVILTFDDGYRDNYINAFPLLKERGMTATFFIVTDFIDDQRPEYLSWDMVREMHAGGMAIESHGRNHAGLANRDADFLVWQALGSLETIEFELGVRPRFVSYPAGEYDENTIRIFQSANYWAGVTTRQGATHNSDDLFQLRRVRVRGTTTADDLMGLLAIDW